MNCTALKQVTIPDTVTTLGGFLFADCTSLERVVIASSICETPYMGSNYWGAMESGAVFARWPGAKTAGPVGLECNIEFAWVHVPSSAFLGCPALTSEPSRPICAHWAPTCSTAARC